MSKELKPGDVVKLMSDGPKMTIESVENGKAVCVWFMAGQLMRHEFLCELLNLISAS